MPYNGEKSLINIKSYIDKNIIPAFGKRPLNEIKGIECQEFINKYSDRPNTQKKISDILYAALQAAYEDEIIPKNPYSKKRLAVSTKQSYRALEFAEQLAVYNNCNDKFKPLFLFACCTGIRIGRILELTAEKNIDYARREIIVFKKQHRGKTETYRVPFLDELNLPKSGRLFPTINYNEVLDYFQSIYKKLGIEKANVHSFRHTFISVCYHIGIKDKQIQMWAGHNSLKMTTDIYMHLLSNETNSPILTYLKALKNKLGI